MKDLQLGVKTICRSVEGPMPCWAGDVAILLPFSRACDVVDNLRAVVRESDIWSRNTGVFINYDANKTEALVVFRGQGSVAERTRHLTCEVLCVDVELSNGDVVQLRLVRQYDHLGGRVCYHGSCLEDIQKRAGQAEAVFKRLSRTLLRNNMLSVVEKVRLLQSLVLRKFLFGAGLWALQTRAEKQAFSTVILGYYRRSVRHVLGFSSQHLNDGEICTVLDVLTPEHLYCVEIVRQLRTVVSHDKGYLWETLCEANGWLQCAFASLASVLGVLGLDWQLIGPWQHRLELLRARVEQMRLLPGIFIRVVLQRRQEAREQILIKAIDCVSSKGQEV